MAIHLGKFSFYLLLSLLAVSCQGTLSDTRAEGDEVAQPVPITGAQLASYDGSRIRCGFQLIQENEYKTTCHIVVMDANNNELKAIQLDKNVSLVWKEQKIEGGALNSPLNCKVDDDSLSQVCRVSTKTSSVKLKAEILLKNKTSGESRYETDTILLPFSIQIAAGSVQAIPFSFKQEVAKNNEQAEKAKLGYQPIQFDSLNVYSPPSHWCARDGKVYYVVGSQIFIHQDGKSMLYAGVPTSGRGDSLSHRLRVQFKNPNLICSSIGVFVKEALGGRLLRLLEIGPTELIADNITAEMVAENGEVYFVKKVTLADLAAGSYYQVNKFTAAGRIEVVFDMLKKESFLHGIDGFQCVGDNCYVTSKIFALALHAQTRQLVLAQSRDEFHKNLSVYNLESKNLYPISFNPEDIQNYFSVKSNFNTFSASQDHLGNVFVEYLPIEASYSMLPTYFDLIPKMGGFSQVSPRKVDKFQEFGKYLEKLGVSENLRSEKYYTLRFDQIKNKEYFKLDDSTHTRIFEKSSNGFREIIGSKARLGAIDQFAPNEKADKARIYNVSSLQVAVDGSLYYLTNTSIYKVDNNKNQILYVGSETSPTYDLQTNEVVIPRYTLPGAERINRFVLAEGRDLVVLTDRRLLRISQDGGLVTIASILDGSALAMIDEQSYLLGFRNGDIKRMDKDGNFSHIINIFPLFIKTSENVFNSRNGNVYSISIRVVDLKYKDNAVFVATSSAVFRLALIPGTWTPDPNDSPVMRGFDLSVGESVIPFNFESDVVTNSTGFAKIQSIALGQKKDDIYISGAAAAQIVLKDSWSESAQFKLFFGPKLNDIDCGVGSLSSFAERNRLEEGIETDLSKICAGSVEQIASFNGCEEKEPENRVFRIVFSQSFSGGETNLVHISRPCQTR